MNYKALRTSAFLCLLFTIVYGGCNQLAAGLPHVGSFYFSCERHIPFVPLMIVPYMSIDLFFVAAPFMCSSEIQRRVLARRITAAILIAGVFFILFPLRFAFDRPHVDGPLGLIFDNFRKLDQPFNQFPSLHIALRTILAVLFVQETTGKKRWATHIWFSLIGFSTLLTYQHHLIDILGGFALGALCVYLFQEEPLAQAVAGNRRVGSHYALGAITLAGLASLTRSWGLLLLWPAFSLGLVAAAYYGLGPGIFRKRDGAVPMLAWLFLWPILLGQKLSLRHYARQSDPWDIVTDELWIGRKLSNAQAEDAIEQGVCAVLDLTSEFTEAGPFRSIEYMQLPIMDLTAPTPDHLDQAVRFLRRNCASGIVYVHCKVGYSRSAAIVGAFLLDTERAQNADQAIAILGSARPGIIIRPEARQAIRDYARARRIGTNAAGRLESLAV